jgi:diacylglycerol kinase family enzyme
MAGVGLDASVIHAIHGQRTGPITHLAYVAPILTALWRYEFVPLQVAVDGRIVFPAAPALAFVANVGEYGAGFTLMPQARSDDGRLDICVVPCNSGRQALQHWLRALAAGHLENRGVISLRGRQVHIESQGKVPVQFDGEPAGWTPLDIGLSPRKIQFIVAENAPA